MIFMGMIWDLVIKLGIFVVFLTLVAVVLSVVPFIVLIGVILIFLVLLGFSAQQQDPEES